MAAAQSAGVFGLEDGLRLAASAGEPEAVLQGVAIASPSIGLVSSATGRLLEPGVAPDAAYWRRQSRETAPPERCADALAELDVEAVIEISPQSVPKPTLVGTSSASSDGTGVPAPIESLRRPPENGEESAARPDGGFVDAVARAYEAGLPVSFAGLFAGEARRRIALPDYPFQRRRHWHTTREQ